ncbi:MAG: hypothetical protein ACK5P5_01815, partial [Pseudobdellovibrionaceae bacterium]
MANFNTRVAFFGFCISLMLSMNTFASKIIVLNDDQSLIECVQWVLDSPSVTSRSQAIQICKKGATKKCMDTAFQSSSIT